MFLDDLKKVRMSPALHGIFLTHVFFGLTGLKHLDVFAGAKHPQKHPLSQIIHSLGISPEDVWRE
jgi:hypothetical protein